MKSGPQAALIDGGRLHLQHGPIDLIIGVDGPCRMACFEAAKARFATLLRELVGELPALRENASPNAVFRGSVARRMARAASAHQGVFVTPMAAVAGSVADEILAAICADHTPAKAYVNNGGDIAMRLQRGARFTVRGAAGDISLTAEDGVGGIATSGWQGRSHSMGIADAVTVLADTAANADVAATLIANAVDLPGHPAIMRQPANLLSPDSDLGARLVTTDVGHLTPPEIDEALARGRRAAQQMVKHGIVRQAALLLRSKVEMVQSAGEVEHA